MLILPLALLWLNAAALYELEMIPFKRQMWCRDSDAGACWREMKGWMDGGGREMTGRRERAWQDSVCLSTGVPAAEWEPICLHSCHLEWGRGQMGLPPSASRWLVQHQCRSFHCSFFNLLPFFSLPPPTFFCLIRKRLFMPHRRRGSRCLGAFGWALITLIEGSEDPVLHL